MKELDVILAEAGRLKELLAVAEKLKALGSLDEALSAKRSALAEAERRRDEAVAEANAARGASAAASNGLALERQSHKKLLEEQVVSFQEKAAGMIAEAKAEAGKIIAEAEEGATALHETMVKSLIGIKESIAVATAELSSLDAARLRARTELDEIQGHMAGLKARLEGV